MYFTIILKLKKVKMPHENKRGRWDLCGYGSACALTPSMSMSWMRYCALVGSDGTPGGTWVNCTWAFSVLLRTTACESTVVSK